MISTDTFEVMPVDVFEGGCGHIVICQEFPHLMQGDCYLRVFIKPEDAEKVALQILTAAEKARRK